MVLKVSQFYCDHVILHQSDFSVLVLAMAVQQCPNVLTLFTLDTCTLSVIGLYSVQSIIRLPSLKHWDVVCTPLRFILIDYIAHVLQRIPCYTL